MRKEFELYLHMHSPPVFRKQMFYIFYSIVRKNTNYIPTCKKSLFIFLIINSDLKIYVDKYSFLEHKLFVIEHKLIV